MQGGFIAERALLQEQLTSLAGATALTNLPAGTSMIMVIPESQAVRWRDDGTDPTAAVGMPLAVGQTLIYTAKRMSQLKFIEQTASAKINVAYYAAA